MDPPSLDTAIQHTLAGLYPPFEATAPIILGQVFRLLDSDFRGDGLSFLLDFLIPAKRLCEQVREAACAPYSHCLFLHEGWPLCLRDEVVVHLAPLNPLLLRQGDFYLQVEPQEEQSVCITIKCLSVDLRTVDTKPVPMSAYTMLFTQAWLEAINSDLEGSPLHNCLVASEDGIVSVPWTKIASPEFVDDRPQTGNVLSPAWGSLQLEALDLSSPQELHQARSPGSQVLLTRSLAKGKSRTSENKYPGLIKVEPAGPEEVAFRMDDVANQDLEGDYVALVDFSQESRGESPIQEVGTSSGYPVEAPGELSGTKEILFCQRKLPLTRANGESSLEKWACEKPESLEEELCILGLRRKVNDKVRTQDSEGQPQEPYLHVLVNPPHRASGLGAGVSEELAATKTQRLLGNPESMVQLRPRPKQASSPRLRPASPCPAPGPENRMEDRTKRGRGRLPKPVTSSGQNTSSSRFPTPGLKFSFLKGPKQAAVPAEKASLQHDGPWKSLCLLYSPKPSRDQCLGKAGTTQTKTSGPDADSDPLTEEKTGFPEASAGPPEKGPALDEQPPGLEPRIGALSVELLRSSIASLPGGRDRAGRPLLLVSTTGGFWEAPWCTASEVAKLFSYLCGIPRPEDKTQGLAVVIDARKQPPHPGLVSALQAAQALVPTPLGAVLFLGEREAAHQLEASPGTQVEVLTSLKALSHHVDPSQLPMALGGPFPYCHGAWVQFFQKLDPFLADLRRASSLLKASIKEFEKGDPPGGVQEAARGLSKSKELMEAVLRDPGLLSLQREGGATLARLRQEGSRLNFNPDVRSHLAKATALYSLVDEQLHVLVTASNHLLRRLGLRVRLGRLEAAIQQVSDWMEQEGSQRLQVLSPKDGSLETVEKNHAEFEDFFLQAAAQYRRGLELSKQAAQLEAAARGAGEAGGSELPELEAFAFTQQAFQAKLTHFYMAAERQRTDLETLLHLHCFCKKVTCFHRDCQDLMTQLRLGKAQRASPGDQRRLHRHLQRLASEFPAEKLTAMGLQVASLSQEGLGQDLWEEARERHEEIQTLLKKALARCPCPAGPPVHPASPELREAAAKRQGLNGEVTPEGRRDPPLPDSLGLDRSPRSYWPPWTPRRGQNRNVRAAPPPQEAGQAIEADGGKSPHGPLDPAPERFLASLFSWQRLPRQSQGPRAAGGSFSSEGTGSLTSLEDSPRTSPPASL
uniref:KIAA1755 n=1 Tax=Catagonus wagneri TaxID=51154 RepID=A0A8C3YIW9_9CETA